VIYIVGAVVAALLFGLFTAVGRSDKGCSGECIGCTRDGACEREGRP
jgi:hypothetical protein